MGLFNRSVLMKAHALLAAFILPVAVMFFVTGALYTWGMKGEYNTSVYKLHLKKPLQNELEGLVNLVSGELKKQNLPSPTGQAKIKKIGDSLQLEWSGSSMDVILETTPQPLIAKLKIKHTSWHRQFVQLHKAKGGDPFKVYATIFAIALLLLLVTGFIMAWQMPKLRKLTLVSTTLGVVVFVAMILSS
ncbi:MAG: hypothetical protein COA83_01370 [Methylophaga sp.]|nr:MAG: hypothetical protein COA83_01370 [Methylophaga sp.]